MEPLDKDNENESEVFDTNNLFIEGANLSNRIKEEEKHFQDMDKLFDPKDNIEFNELNVDDILKVDDIKIPALEDEIEGILKETAQKIVKEKNKNLFNVVNMDASSERKENNEMTEEQKENYLRLEAKVLKEKTENLTLKSYDDMKEERLGECHLKSYEYFKQLEKKGTCKEGNYIFNFRDNYLNDMQKIDRVFFQEYFKPKKIPEKFKDELVYEFYVYHPINNIKTQEISVLGSGNLTHLKDKIYCVVDEIKEVPQNSFFFIEKVFYDHVEVPNTVPLSDSVTRNINVMGGMLFNKSDDENILEKSVFSSFEPKNYISEEVLGKLQENAYKSFKMESIPLKYVPMRIGYPYIFRHSDSCDHMFLLKDIRKIDSYDSFKFEEINGDWIIKEENISYVTYQRKLERRKCEACNLYFAKFVSINDAVVGQGNSAFFICDHCLMNIHGKDLSQGITSNVKIIPYYHD